MIWIHEIGDRMYWFSVWMRQKTKYQRIQIECQSWMCGMHSLIFILFRILSFAMCLFKGQGRKGWWIMSCKRAFVATDWVSRYTDKKHISFGISRLWMRVNYSFENHSIHYVQVPWHHATTTKKTTNEITKEWRPDLKAKKKEAKSNWFSKKQNVQ